MILNPYISVDCLVFGFDETEGLKVLLIDRDPLEKKTRYKQKLKLPGNLIIKKEPLNKSATRILYEFTGIDNLYLKQFEVFDDPGRLNVSDDLRWLEETSQINIDRVVTIAYYSLVKLNRYSETKLSKAYNACWYGIKNIPELIFDHKKILTHGLIILRKEFLAEPLCFELLPEKFTLNQLQRIYEEILGLKLDNRNFRKKINRLEYIVPLNEKQSGVNHKPARFYKFNKELFEHEIQEHTGIII